MIYKIRNHLEYSHVAYRRSQADPTCMIGGLVTSERSCCLTPSCTTFPGMSAAAIRRRADFAGHSDKAEAGKVILKRMGYPADAMPGDFLSDAGISVADCYLLVRLRVQKNDLDVPAALAA